MEYNDIVKHFQHGVFGNLTTIRSIKDPNKIWFLGAEIQKFLGHSNLTQAIKDAKLKSDETFILKKSTNPNFFNEIIKEHNISKFSSSITLISKDGIIKMIANSDKILNKENILNGFGMNDFIILKTRNEINFGLNLMKFCDEFKIKCIINVYVL